jgi:DUF971 family protein
VTTAPWPTELRAHDGGRWLRVSFDDGVVADLAASDLRRRSPSAEGRGHGMHAPQRPEGRYDAVTIRALAPVGRYAVRISFDDGHDTGLFTWGLLRRLAEEVTAPPSPD